MDLKRNDFFQVFMDASSRSDDGDKVIVLYPGHQIFFDTGRINHNVHALFDSLG